MTELRVSANVEIYTGSGFAEGLVMEKEQKSERNMDNEPILKMVISKTLCPVTRSNILGIHSLKEILHLSWRG